MQVLIDIETRIHEIIISLEFCADERAKDGLLDELAMLNEWYDMWIAGLNRSYSPDRFEDN